MSGSTVTLPIETKPDIHKNDVNIRYNVQTETELSSEINIKSEKIKFEQADAKDCLLCLLRTEDYYDIFWEETISTKTVISAYVSRNSSINLESKSDFSKVICKACLDIINLLEQAEIAYAKAKQIFYDLLSKNPLFDFDKSCHLSLVTVDVVKDEVSHDVSNNEAIKQISERRDSDDEPLIQKRGRGRPRKTDKRKKRKSDKVKKSTKISKNNIQSQPVNYTCNVCGEVVTGLEAGAVHILTEHQIDVAERPDVLIQTSEDNQPPSPLQDDRDFDDDTADNDWIPNENQSENTERTRKQKAPDFILGDVENSKKERRKLKSGSKKKEFYKCSECGAAYNSLSRLKFHLKKHEAAKPPFICEICGAHYKHKRACDIHVAMHKGISDWRCDQCNKIFPSKGALHRHNAIHTGKPNYQCDLCGKSFIHTSSFKMHKLVHAGTKPHSCDVCGLALMTRSHLKRHKRIHTGEKRFECSICGKKFSERYNMLAHTKSHEAPVAPVATTPKVRKPQFKCTLCDTRFERRYMVDKHMEVTHQRIVERGPPKPRNTMTKLLKAQAAAAAKTQEIQTQTNLGEPTQAPLLRDALLEKPTTPLDRKPFVLVTVAPGEDEKKDIKHSPRRSPPTIMLRDIPGENATYQESLRTSSAWNGTHYVAEYGMRMPDFNQ